jgi:hypothetical protein
MGNIALENLRVWTAKKEDRQTIYNSTTVTDKFGTHYTGMPVVDIRTAALKKSGGTGVIVGGTTRIGGVIAFWMPDPTLEKWQNFIFNTNKLDPSAKFGDWS